MGQVDLLLAAFTQELLDLVAAVGKGGGLGSGRRGTWTVRAFFSNQSMTTL